MLNQLKKRKDEAGFSIIEVLIVLAIAGLIMVVVFLAVPALNRNSHNNQYKTEARNILGAAQEVMNNNGGGALTTGDQATVISSANLKTVTNLVLVDPGTATTTTQAVSLGQARLVLGHKCSGANTNTTTNANATTRSVALVFRIESANTTAAYQCMDE